MCQNLQTEDHLSRGVGGYPSQESWRPSESLDTGISEIPVGRMKYPAKDVCDRMKLLGLTLSDLSALRAAGRLAPGTHQSLLLTPGPNSGLVTIF